MLAQQHFKNIQKFLARTGVKSALLTGSTKTSERREVHQGLEPKKFPVSEDVVQREYCVHSGLLASGTCVTRETGYYKEDALPDVCDYGY